MFENLERVEVKRGKILRPILFLTEGPTNGGKDTAILRYTAVEGLSKEVKLGEETQSLRT